MKFVFGSNEAGIHGAGAALDAYKNHGAILHQGFGPAGNSFAIPTKDWNICTMDMISIEFYVSRFLAYARMHPNEEFKVTAIGCGYAGYRHSDMAPFFINAPGNCLFDLAWKPVLGPEFRYWGTFG